MLQFSKEPTDLLGAVDAAEAARARAGAESGASPLHVVQFYEADDFLHAAVADWIASGLAAGERALVVATPTHRAGVLASLAARGVAPDIGDDRLLFLDARELLARFLEGHLPDEARFLTAIGGVLDRLEDGGHRVRAFGEMVDVLWKDGHIEGAVRLEAIWDELVRTRPVSLLCAYEMANFSRAAHAEQFRAICGHHGHVVPTERYTSADDVGRLLEISELQQRAHALESELAHRGRLEQQLRDALAEAEQARARADEANRAKSEFLAVISHELRTPLNAIAGYAELLHEGVYGTPTEAQREALERIRRSQRHLLALINEVLSFARIEAGTTQYVIEDMALDDVLHGAEIAVLPQVRARALQLDGAAREHLPIARGDRKKVQQIVLNLLANAAKFTPRGGRIRVECGAVAGMIHVRVHDTGIGIPPEKLETIFEPFVQVDTALTRTSDGIGLGLAISRRFAQEMGGDLVATSVVGEGSTFTLTLPTRA